MEEVTGLDQNRLLSRLFSIYPVFAEAMDTLDGGCLFLNLLS